MSKFDPNKVLLDIKSLFGNSPSEIDQHASPRNIAEYAKALAAVFSIATLHVLFFWLNLNFVLWPLIDLSFLLNVTFSFGLFLALGLLVVRATPVFATIVSFFAITFYFGCVTTIRLKKNKSRYAQRSRILEQLERFKGTVDRRFFLVFKAVLALYLYVPFPSRAAAKVAARKQRFFVEKFLPPIKAASYFGAAIVLCAFYTGFDLLVALVGCFYLLLFVVGIVDPQNKDSVPKAISGFVSSGFVEYHHLLKISDKVRRELIAGILVVVSFLSAATGHLRFEYLTSKDAALMELSTGNPVRIEQFASNFKGIFYVDDRGQQAFAPYDSIVGIRE